MNEMQYKHECGRLMDAGDVEAFRSHLESYPQFRETQVKFGEGGCRNIDYLQNLILTHVHNEVTAIGMLKVLLEFGADFNRSHYTQCGVGYLNGAAGLSLTLTKFFVENGAVINHDLFGRPASWPLLSAVCSAKLDIVRFLVENGAVVNFVNVHGLSPLDYTPPNAEMHTYLLARGAKSGTELPRDHLPNLKSDSDIASHSSIREHLQFCYGGKVDDFPLREIVPGDPPFGILKVPRWEGGYVGFITDGLSARPMRVPDGVDDSVPRAEFGVLLPPDWPLDELSLRESRHRWPFDWLRRIARWPFESDSYYRRANIVANGEPPEPLGEGTEFTSWLIRVHHSEEEGRWIRPDGKTVELMMLTPLFTAEREFERKQGLAALLQRLEEDYVRYSIHTGRSSAT